MGGVYREQTKSEFCVQTFDYLDDYLDNLNTQLRRWRQCVSRIEPLAGLIFGLELRLEEAKEGRQPLEVVFINVIIITFKCRIIISILSLSPY